MFKKQKQQLKEEIGGYIAELKEFKVVPMIFVVSASLITGFGIGAIVTASLYHTIKNID